MFPEMEAIAGEVALLRRHFRPSVAWGISPARWCQVSWRRGFGVHPRMHLAFRAATWLLQRAFSVNHIFGSLGDWFHLKAARKRPTVLTIATESQPCDRALLERVDRFVVEWPAARDGLNSLGIESSRIDLAFPPVDLDRFKPNGVAGESPTVLFATSPDRSDSLEARGVGLLVEVAARMPNVGFRLLWRPWGDSLPAVREMIEERELRNIELVCERVDDMAAEYRRVSVTIAPFVDMSRCKAVPNSIVESMACGRPVVVTDGVGLAEVISDAKCGAVSTPTVDRLCAAIARTISNGGEMGQAARRTAERWFSADEFVANYRRVYSQVL